MSKGYNNLNPKIIPDYCFQKSSIDFLPACMAIFRKFVKGIKVLESQSKYLDFDKREPL